MLFMVIEHFKNKDAKAIYRRLRDQGRMQPEGLKYVSSWIDAGLNRCWQVMECDDVRLLQQWIACWSDLTEFEIVPVVPSQDVQALMQAVL
jgi:hypothetical protein